MADYPWQIDGWEARIEATGWPEWAYEGDDVYRQRLHHCKNGEWSVQTNLYHGQDWSPGYGLGNHQAACLIREHWRVWLDEREFYVVHRRIGAKGVDYWAVLRGCQPLGADGAFSFDWEHETRFPTYDTAQAAAVDAVLKEKADER